jgi:hypothetical protein
MTTKTITTSSELRDNAYETIPGFGWDWPDEARLTAFAEQVDRTEQNDRVEQTDRTLENNAEYAALYFVS